MYFGRAGRWQGVCCRCQPDRGGRQQAASIPGSEWIKERNPETASQAVKEYMATLDDAAFRAACPCRKPYPAWQSIENRTMIVHNEGSLQAHWLDGCRSDPVAGNA